MTSFDLSKHMMDALDATLKKAVGAGIAEGRRRQHEADLAAFGESYRDWWKDQETDFGYLDGFHRMLVIERLRSVAPGR